MLDIRPRQAPALPVAQRMLASIFGAQAVRTGGSLFDRLEARGTWRGLRVRVELAYHQTRKRVAPFATIDVEEDLDVSVYTGGAEWPYPSHEPFVPFSAERLEGMAVVGAPRALVRQIAHGPVADRLGWSGLSRLTIGADARRDGCATRGLRLEVEGWPMDDASLVFLLDTVAEITTAARRELAAGVAPLREGRHPEVVAYETARKASRAQGLEVVAAIGASLCAVTMLAASVLVFVAH